MNELRYDCPKSGAKLGAWIFLGLIALMALKSAVKSYLQGQDTFYVFLIVLSVAGILCVAYMIHTYFKYKMVSLIIAVQGNDLSVINKDEQGGTIQETHVELNKIHRTWILKSKAGYRLVVVFEGNTSSEKRIRLVPSQMYDIEENEATRILSFIQEHNPAVKVGYM